MQRPPRPFGVSLAIIAAFFMFSLLPLLQVGLLLVVQSRFNSVSLPEDYPQPITGGEILGLSSSGLLLQLAVAIAFLLVAALAWRGRPPVMRFIFVSVVVLLTVVKLVVLVAGRLAAAEVQVGVSSLDSIVSSVQAGQLVIEALVTLYVLWYMNRGPARAFYRGYYLPEGSSE
ncbi:MAG: hypothetical protein JNJ61_16510 [Anaerolineae bacterium]|nr:hypothetical protein [Anaerolineae bacterium]